MKITFSEKQNTSSDALVIALTDSLKLGKQAQEINTNANDALKKAIKTRDFKGEKNETIVIVAPSGVKYDQIILVGLGKEKKITNLEI